MRNISEQQYIKRITSYNLHWLQNEVTPDISSKQKRKYFFLFLKLVTEFNVQRAIVLMGPRRVGKTIMLQQTIQTLLEQGHIAKSLCYIPLDEPLLNLLTLDELVALYYKASGHHLKTQTTIIFDEIQYIQDWSMQLKRLVDNHPNIKFIVSGSAAGALKQKSQESGAGRFTDFMLPPLTFYEYLELLKLTDKYFDLDPEVETEIKKAICVKNIDGLNKEFINYLNYGGFPEAIFNKDIRENPERFIRQDIIDKVLLRDLPSLYGITNVQELNRFFGYLCYQTGNEVSYESLSKSSGISSTTIRRYIEYLESAFLIRTVNRVNENGKTFKRTNFIKVYLTNPSMYAALYGIISEQETTILGNLVETAVFSQFGHETRWLNNVYYARFKRGKSDTEREVDMVYLDQKFKVKWCLEVKWSDRYPTHPKELRGLINFSKQNEPETITISTKTINKQVSLDKKIHFKFKEAALICFNIGCNSIVEGLL